MSDHPQPRVNGQVFGLALLTAFSVIYTFITLVFLNPSDAVGAVIFTLVTGTVTYLVWRYDRVWSIALGLVVTLAVALVAFFTIFGIFQIFSPLEFITALLMLFGILFALIGGIVALATRRREVPPGQGGARLRSATLAIIGVASVISIVGFLVNRETVSEAQAGGATVVDMEEFEFVPETLTVSQGDTLLMTNSDGFAHDLTLEAADIYVYYGPGSESLVDLSDLGPGTYEFFCSLHTFDGEGMTGTLTVEG